MKKRFHYLFLLLFFIFIYPSHSEGKYFNVNLEFGAGHYINLGFEYNFARGLSLFRSFQYVKSLGIITGFTYLAEEKIYEYEPGLYFTGEILENRIMLKKDNPLNINWRIKAGRLYLKSKEYDLKAEVWTVSVDFLFQAFKYYFIDVSLPFIKGIDTTEIAPCIGAGVMIGLF